VIDQIHQDEEQFWRELPLILGQGYGKHGAFCIGLLTQRAREKGGYPTFAAMWEAARQDSTREFYERLNP
jgi:hypothetical protein